MPHIRKPRVDEVVNEEINFCCITFLADALSSYPITTTRMVGQLWEYPLCTPMKLRIMGNMFFLSLISALISALGPLCSLSLSAFCSLFFLCSLLSALSMLSLSLLSALSLLLLYALCSLSSLSLFSLIVVLLLIP